MRKIACTAALLALAAAPAGAHAQTVPTRAALQACHTGSAPLDRYAVFTAQLGAVPDTQRMQVRFDLQQKLTGGDFRRVVAPGLGVWRSSIPGIDIFRYRKQVANLPAPGSYRALVRFRWLDANGKVIAGATRRTRTCKQPDLRPDLSVGTVTAQPAADGRARYAVLVRNEGRTASSVFSVGFAVGDQTQPTQAVQSLIPGEGRVLTFAAPRCSRSAPVRVTVDPDLAIDEADETNNTRTIVCPI
jgi:CARDB